MSFFELTILHSPRLLIKDMRMPQDKIREIPMDKVSLIEGSRVTPINANHSPGACMFLIQTKATAEQKSQVHPWRCPETVVWEIWKFLLI